MTVIADALKGRRILLVEDEYFIADDVRRSIAAHGGEVVGPVGNVDDALGLLDNSPDIDGAVLDINLRGGMVYPVADRLMQSGVPFIFLTGYDSQALPPRYSNIQHCEKPLGMGRVIAALQQA